LSDAGVGNDGVDHEILSGVGFSFEVVDQWFDCTTATTADPDVEHAAFEKTLQKRDEFFPLRNDFRSTKIRLERDRSADEDLNVNGVNQGVLVQVFLVRGLPDEPLAEPDGSQRDQNRVNEGQRVQDAGRVHLGPNGEIHEEQEPVEDRWKCHRRRTF
tara:strand:- start:20894 stop:21367 length:474 start_codon:yes stop_codon:yes gene_type:complete